MGGGSWSTDAYSTLKKDYSTKSKDAIFTKKSIDSTMSPKGITFRESRDSTDHPESLAVSVYLDETGSMDEIPAYLVKEKLGSLMEILVKHGVKDAHVMFGGVGDHEYDSYALQVGQFEAGTAELNKWLTSIVLERGGGANAGESYSLPWLFNARHTSIDCFEKRGQKGFLFTIGDEPILPKIPKSYLTSYFGYEFQDDVLAENILAEVQKTHHVFHLHINHGRGRDGVPAIWKKLLGQNVIEVDDYKEVAEIIGTTVAVMHGADIADITADMDSSTSASVSRALSTVVKNAGVAKQSTGIITL